jgi:hypothetical protein
VPDIGRSGIRQQSEKKGKQAKIWKKGNKEIRKKRKE